MKALVNFQPLSFNTSGEYFLIWKQISTSPEGLRSKEVARPPLVPPPYPHPQTRGLWRLLASGGQSWKAWTQRILPHSFGWDGFQPKENPKGVACPRSGIFACPLV